jgi:hypothetical protein
MMKFGLRKYKGYVQKIKMKRISRRKIIFPFGKVINAVS